MLLGCKASIHFLLNISTSTCIRIANQPQKPGMNFAVLSSINIHLHQKPYSKFSREGAPLSTPKTLNKFCCLFPYTQTLTSKVISLVEKGFSYQPQYQTKFCDIAPISHTYIKSHGFSREGVLVLWLFLLGLTQP